MFEDEDTRIYVLVVNEQEQYSVWPGMRPLPLPEWMAEQPRSTDG